VKPTVGCRSGSGDAARYRLRKRREILHLSISPTQETHQCFAPGKKQAHISTQRLHLVAAVFPATSSPSRKQGLRPNSQAIATGMRRDGNRETLYRQKWPCRKCASGVDKVSGCEGKGEIRHCVHRASPLSQSAGRLRCRWRFFRLRTASGKTALASNRCRKNGLARRSPTPSGFPASNNACSGQRLRRSQNRRNFANVGATMSVVVAWSRRCR